jgi:RNA polymerase sigma factor (sigma-70 family)
MDVDDRTLVTRARAGEAHAFALLLERHRARLLASCAGVLGGDPGTCADVAQDAALTAWLQLDRLRDAARFGAWLAGIGRMLSLRAARERANARVRLTADGSLPEPAVAEEPIAVLLAAERAGELAAAIAGLPPGQREAVVLFHLAELPQAAVAERLGTSRSAVSTRLDKGRAALRARLTKETRMPARILDVRRTPAGRHVVILAHDGGELPIWIGAPEAHALVVELAGIDLPRPSSHALALSLLAACGRRATAVRIARLEAAVFYAEVALDNGATVDARPSDALVLAAAAGLPIELDPAAIPAGPPPDAYDDDLAGATDGLQALAGEIRAQLAAGAEELARLRAD